MCECLGVGVAAGEDTTLNEVDSFTDCTSNRPAIEMPQPAPALPQPQPAAQFPNNMATADGASGSSNGGSGGGGGGGGNGGGCVGKNNIVIGGEASGSGPNHGSVNGSATSGLHSETLSYRETTITNVSSEASSPRSPQAAGLLSGPASSSSYQAESSWSFSQPRPSTPLLVNGHSFDSMGSAGTGTSSPAKLCANSPGACSSGSTNSTSGPRYKLLHSGDIQLCRLNHTRTIVSKIMNSKYLRRWESHHLELSDCEIRSLTPLGFMETPILYSSIEEVNIISRWDAGQKFCIRITIPDGSVLLQATNFYLRDQWLHSIQWKRYVLKYERLLKNTRRPEVLIKEIKSMIDLSLNTPLQDESVQQFPLDLVSQLLQVNTECISQVSNEEIIVALAPLLEHNPPTQEICDFFSKHCKNSPRSEIVIELFTPVVQRILKHTTDFGKYPRMRTFIQEYVQALSCQNDGINVVKNFVRSMHGQTSQCPHPRVMPNVVAVCLSATFNCYEDRKSTDQLNNSEMQVDNSDINEKIASYIAVLEVVSEYEDWLPPLGSLLQPIPFPDDALADTAFTAGIKQTIQNVAQDARCEVHTSVLGLRENKEGWFQLFCPGGIACDDEGAIYSIMLKTLINCCCKRKPFLVSMAKMVSPCQLLALRENIAAMEVLSAMLEYDVIDSGDMKLQIITTLQSTSQGKHMYTELCERQIALRELQQKGGPKKLTLPSRSTDADLARMLSSGSFGNLECLSLAFTQVTSACAADLIKLPSLRYLNLWSTQFGDAGLELLSEHLQKLQVLNLCETPVTDKGLNCLSEMKSLRKLNLNSTNLSALTFEGLQENLPVLQECDVRYTDAW